MTRLTAAACALTCLASLALPAAALADPPPWAHGGGNGGGHGGNPHGEPPGLAKKPYGMPPGQAKKLWKRGERLPMAYVEGPDYVIYEPVRYHLRPPPPGYRWVRVDDRFYLAQTETGMIAEAIAAMLR